MIQRFGFCCKWLNSESEFGGMKVNAKDRELNGRSTTMRWLREHKDEAIQRQWDIMTHNTLAARRLVQRVGTLPPERRMVRLGSEMLQGYTEKDWKAWWQEPDLQKHLANLFAPVGEMARRLDVKVSFHPGQFCVLASDTPEIVERSIEEFEYHADMARWMGFGKSFQDGCKINVHISGRQGPEGIRKALPRLSPEARNLITIENDEMGHGLAALMVGGEFHKFYLYSDASGVAYTSREEGIASAIVSAGGLVGPAILGGILFAFAHRAKWLFLLFGVGLLVAEILVVRNLFGLVFVGSDVVLQKTFVPAQYVWSF